MYVCCWSFHVCPTECLAQKIHGSKIIFQCFHMPCAFHIKFKNFDKRMESGRSNKQMLNQQPLGCNNPRPSNSLKCIIKSFSNVCVKHSWINHNLKKKRQKHQEKLSETEAKRKSAMAEKKPKTIKTKSIRGC